MSTIPRADSRRLYSWWWDSHISPKNSKWLQENLKDMDMKVKAMIKLIEEDADSFARRAEMYYKKRPELMKLVEEFYRAYRALAERYDVATGALRHAHRTMSEAFPNHIPLALPDESLSNNTSEMPSPKRALFDSEDLQKNAFGVPTHFNAFDRIGPPEENETLATRKGLKHFNETPFHQEGVGHVKLSDGNGMKGINVHEEEGTARVRLPEGKVRRSLNFKEEEENAPHAKIYIDSKSHFQTEHKEKENVRCGVKHLQEQVSQLSSENQKLKIQIELESKHLDLSRAEVQNLRDDLSKLESEKDAAFLQNQLSYENISSLEIEISKVKNEIRKLNEEMEMANLKLSSAEQQCLALEKANQSLQLELEEAKRELEELRLSLKENDQMRIEALQSSEQLYNQSNEKVLLMTLEIQILVEKLKEIERSKVGLEEEVLKLKDINYTLNEHNFACALKMKHLENEIISLKEINGKLEDEIETHAESKKILQQELDSLKDDKNEIDLKHQILTKQMEAASLHIESLETLVKDLQYGHAELKECCSKLEDEKFLFLNKLNDMESVSERNSVLENSLSDANVELEQLREKIKVLEGSCESLSAAVSKHVGEKTAIAIQIEILTRNVEKLSEKNTLLENSLADANTELEGLRSKLRGLEESCQSLSHANSDLLAHKDDLISQVKSIKQSLADLETTHTTLEGKHLNLVKEKDLSVNKIMNLEDSLSAIQKEHESLINSKNICLANLENQLHLLQEDKRLREEELEAEQQRYFYHMTEIFILQRCLFDMSDSLIIGKQKYESLIQSSEIQLSALESQIHLLQEERKVGENKIEEEEKKSMNSLLEIFILQRCLSEMKGENFTLFQECQKMLEGSRCSDELIKHLEDRDLVQKENITLLMEHISNVRYGIQRLLKPLNINKELMNIDGSEVVILPTILGEIKNLLASISDFHDAKQFNRMEILVYLTLLKQIGLEKVLLSQELEKIDRQSLVFQREHRELFDTYEKLCHDTSVKDSSNITLKAEMESLTRKLVDSSEKLYNLREEKNALEEENSVMCMEAMTLEHLYLFFRSLNAESMQQLKLLSGDMFSLLTVNNGLDEEIRGSKERERAVGNENKQLKESLVLLEELISRTTISEFDMYSAWSFCEELILQVEAGENLLKEKNMDLSKAIDMLQCKQAEFAEVCRKFEVSNKELDETKITRSELETRIAVLLEGTACKDKQIASINEENRTLNAEFSRFKVEVEALKMREQSLSFELQNEKEEFDRCEGEMIELFSEVQASVVNAAVLDEKMFELASRCESLEISAMVQKETLKEEITLKNTHAVELKKKLVDFENENEKLRTNLKVLSPLFFSLGNVISYLEEHVCQLAKLNGSQDNPSSHHQENLETSTGDQATMAGVLELQNLIAKVEALQKLVVGTKSYLDQEKLQSVTDLESARREIEELKLKESSIREEKQGKETSNMVKDIELDQVSSSCGASRIQGSESNDQMLKSWETADMDNSNRVSTDHDIEAVEEVKSEKSSSELNVEKDVGVYKLEISREIKESQEDWNRRVIKRLAFDAEKLSALQGSVQELKLKMEKSGTSTRQNRLQFDTIEAKLKDAEAAISDLVDKNGKLAMMVEVYSNSFSGEEMGRAERSQVLAQARSQSDRIGLLELELQKIDYIFLKLEEEWESYPTGGGDRTPRVLLRDYLYGRKDRQGKKRGYFCGCMRPRTQDGH